MLQLQDFDSRPTSDTIHLMEIRDRKYKREDKFYLMEEMKQDQETNNLNHNGNNKKMQKS